MDIISNYTFSFQFYLMLINYIFFIQRYEVFPTDNKGLLQYYLYNNVVLAITMPI